jgi:hypothetical protein
MIIAVLPVIINISVAMGALLLGAALIVFSPWVLNRRSRSNGANAPSPSVLARWLKILIVDVIACTLLFSGAHSFGLFSTLTTLFKVASILFAALVISSVSSLFFFKKG